MALQEFLASYAVEVDESGAARLQEVLESNRDLANELADAFDAARTALSSLTTALDTSDLQASLEEGLDVSDLSPLDLPADLDLTAAEESAERFTANLESLRPKLSVNTTGITSAVSSAVSSIRSMLASVSITVPVRAVAMLDTSGLPDSSGSPPGNGPTGNSSPASIPSGASSIPAYGSGGRVASPTFAMIAEEGEPEYVIPVQKEEQAVPLLRELLLELSDSALETLFGNKDVVSSVEAAVHHDMSLNRSPYADVGEAGRGESMDFSSLSSDLSSLIDSVRSQFLPAGVPAPTSSNSVEAPVTINVTAASASPEEVGRSVYDLTQRYLLRTMKGVF